MQEKRTIWTRIIPASILLICIIASFAAYRYLNRNMTVSRNAKYVEDAATQTAKRIEDLLVGAENSISAIAHLYEHTMDPKQIDIKTLQTLVDDTPFDYIGIVDVNGIYTDNRGMQANVSDRYYFQDGMEGQSGMDIIFNGRIAHENLMIFYAPLWVDGEVAGVLTGRYGENQMREIILAQEGVEGIDDIKTRLFGAKMYVDVEISVDGDKTLRAAHEIANRVHDAIEDAFPEVKHCMVHENPTEEATGMPK